MNELQKYWEQKYETAIDNTRKLRKEEEEKGPNGKFSVLIEVAAQHPLTENDAPGQEYCNRLNEAARLFNYYHTRGYKARLYLPGSLHRGDKLSLSEAGEKYILDNIIAEDIKVHHIYGNKFNKMYKSEGVYCTEDECEVATKIFLKEKFTDIISICSPAQLLRKSLMYINFGIIPQMRSVPIQDPSELWHDYVAEACHLIPDFLHGDRTNQEELIAERKPENSELKVD